jgi:hypothetical protein
MLLMLLTWANNLIFSIKKCLSFLPCILALECGTLGEIDECRRNARFATNGCTLVALGDDSRLGEVLDVSAGGLAFRCIAGEEPAKKYGQLNVYCNNGLCLTKLPFKMIWDSEISDPAPFNYITTRRFGVRFGDLTQDQMSSLSLFINSHTNVDPEG